MYDPLLKFIITNSCFNFTFFYVNSVYHLFFLILQYINYFPFCNTLGLIDLYMSPQVERMHDIVCTLSQKTSWQIFFHAITTRTDGRICKIQFHILINNIFIRGEQYDSKIWFAFPNQPYESDNSNRTA